MLTRGRVEAVAGGARASILRARVVALHHVVEDGGVLRATQLQ
jgi:hypothetical protein